MSTVVSGIVAAVIGIVGAPLLLALLLGVGPAIPSVLGLLPT